MPQPAWSSGRQLTRSGAATSPEPPPAAAAVGRVRTSPTVDEALGAVRGMPPTAAALAIGMLGARHGASALPPSASDATHEADGLAALLLSLTLRDETRRP